jgi:16S rRNA (cytidine1402-2'-O)-methyltransferase
MPGTLYVVATPIGNLEDVTLRALRVLREVALIAAEDTRRTARLLQHYSISTRTTSLHEHNERSKTPSLIADLLPESRSRWSRTPARRHFGPRSHLVPKPIGGNQCSEPIPGPNARLPPLGSGWLQEGIRLCRFPTTRSLDRKRWLQRLAMEPRR